MERLLTNEDVVIIYSRVVVMRDEVGEIRGNLKSGGLHLALNSRSWDLLVDIMLY